MSPIQLYVSATTPDFTPDMGETLAAVAHTASAWLNIPYSAIEPVLGYWEGQQEFSTILTLDPSVSAAKAVEFASALASLLNQDAVMVVSDRPAKGYAGHTRRDGGEAWMREHEYNYTRAIASGSAHTYIPRSPEFPVTHYVAFVTAEG